jgi:hypothetical protein
MSKEFQSTLMLILVFFLLMIYFVLPIGYLFGYLYLVLVGIILFYSRKISFGLQSSVATYTLAVFHSLILVFWVLVVLFGIFSLMLSHGCGNMSWTDVLLNGQRGSGNCSF